MNIGILVVLTALGTVTFLMNCAYFLDPAITQVVLPKFEYPCVPFGEFPTPKVRMVLVGYTGNFQTIDSPISTDMDDEIVDLEIFDATVYEDRQGLRRRFASDAPLVRSLMRVGNYKNVQSVGIVFDVTDRATFEDVLRIHQEVSHFTHDAVRKFLIANTSATASFPRLVSSDEATALADQLGLTYVEATSENRDALLKDVVSEVKTYQNANMREVCREY